MKVFKRFNGSEIKDVDKYILDRLEKFPETEIILGTDSQNKGKWSVYTTVICFRYLNKGTHIIFTRERIKRKKDLFARLWEEVERSKMIADHIAKVLLEAKCSEDFKFSVHLDLNPNPAHKSHTVYQASMGYITGLGYDAVAKPAAWAASHAADMLCH